MTRLVTINYDEYVDLKNKAEVNQKQITKKAIKLFREFQKQDEENHRLQEVFEKRGELEKLTRFKIFLISNTNSFGYIKTSKIDEYIDKHN